MGTNKYFNNFPTTVTSEQLLMEDLVIETLQIHGMDIYYLPRGTQGKVDYLFGEDQLKQYTSAYPIEMYLENVTGMEGEGDFISKFGLEIRDEARFLVSRRRFAKEIPLVRPREGDLVYIPLIENFFEITFVEHENDQAMFYTLGRGRGGNIYVYALKLKQFVFSNEVINTGVSEIDRQIRDNYNRVKLSLININGTFIPDEPIHQPGSNSHAIVHSYVANSHIEVYRVNGSFNGTLVTGNTSGATANVSISDDLTIMDNFFEDIVDNNRIEVESDQIMDFSERNPFGEA